MANPSSDECWLAVIHDLRGVLGGLKATLDLREADAGLSARDATRMDAGVREGATVLELARALMIGPWPDGSPEPAAAWASTLAPELAGMAAAYRGQASLEMADEGSWPGLLLRRFTLSLSRLLMPQALPDPLMVKGEGRADAWLLRFRPVLAPPLALQPDGAPKDLHGLWVRAVAGRCDMVIEHSGETLQLTIPRHAGGLPPVK